MGKPTLIAVDDQADMADFVREVAELVGYSAQIAESVAEFRNMTTSGFPDAIVLDLVMPETDGIELIRELAERGCRSDLVLLSGFHGRYVDVAARIAEAKGLRIAAALTKPVPLERLEAALKHAVAGGGAST